MAGPPMYRQVGLGMGFFGILSFFILLMVLRQTLNAAAPSTMIRFPATPGEVLPQEDEQLLRTLVRNAMLKVTETRNFLKSGKAAQAEYTANMTMENRHAAPLTLQHQFPCLWSESKEPSIVTLYDGAKYVCGLQELAQRAQDRHTWKQCIVYSFGSSGNSAFEETVKSLTRDACEIHTFDPTVHDKAVIAKLSTFMHFHQIGLADHDDADPRFPVETLKSVMDDLGHDHIDILKVDIESFEFSVMKSWNWKTLPVGQFLVEMHWNTSTKITDVWELLGPLHEAGYFIFNAEPNTANDWPCRDVDAMNELAMVHWKWSPRMPPPAGGYGGLPKDWQK